MSPIGRNEMMNKESGYAGNNCPTAVSLGKDHLMQPSLENTMEDVDSL